MTFHPKFANIHLIRCELKAMKLGDTFLITSSFVFSKSDIMKASS